MFLIELMVPLLMIFFMFYLRLTKRPSKPFSFALLLTVSIGLLTVSIFCGFCWLYYTMYLAYVILLVLTFLYTPLRGMKSIYAHLTFGSTFLFIFASLSLIVIFPIRTLPVPTGPHHVGTFS